MGLGRVCDDGGGRKKELKTLSSIGNRRSIVVPKILRRKKRRRKRRKNRKEGERKGRRGREGIQTYII